MRKVYIGLTEKTFNESYNRRKSSLNNETYLNSTTLSTYIHWEPKIKRHRPLYSIVSQVKAYNEIQKLANYVSMKNWKFCCIETKEN